MDRGTCPAWAPCPSPPSLDIHQDEGCVEEGLPLLCSVCISDVCQDEGRMDAQEILRDTAIQGGVARWVSEIRDPLLQSCTVRQLPCHGLRD